MPIRSAAWPASVAFSRRKASIPTARPIASSGQRLAARGTEILDRLKEVRRGLLTGTVPKSRLQELAQLVREKRERGADPLISRLLDEIELRAEVELAKLSPRSG